LSGEDRGHMNIQLAGVAGRFARFRDAQQFLGIVRIALRQEKNGLRCGGASVSGPDFITHRRACGGELVVGNLQCSLRGAHAAGADPRILERLLDLEMILGRRLAVIEQHIGIGKRVCHPSTTGGDDRVGPRHGDAWSIGKSNVDCFFEGNGTLRPSRGGR
jgi:hypothetical protein